MGKKKQKKNTLSPRQKVVGAYLTLMFGVFPLFCTDGFFNIRHDRYYFFLALSGALLAFWGITWLGGDRKGSIGKLHVTDWAMLGFLAVCAVSTIFSIAPVQALLGTAGRNNGLLLMAVYVGIYFAVSRYGRPGPVAFAALGIVSAFVSVLTVLNFFSLDPLGMLEELSAADKKIFFSTIGNKNLLSGYLCITLPVLTVIFIEDSRKWLRVLALCCLAPGFAALMAADSDSGLLGLGAFAALYVLRYIRHPGKLKRFFLVMTVMLLSARLLQPISAIPSLEAKTMSHLQQFFVYSVPGIALLLVVAGITVALELLDRKRPDLLLPKWVCTAWIALFCTLFTAVIVAMSILTLNPEIPVRGLWQHLRLDYTWGTNRGFMWSKTMEIFWDFSLWRKLFGSGPDTFYYTFQPYFDELTKYWTSSTNAAHNEYLNYLITVGLLGAAAYCTALISGVVRGFRSISRQPMVAVYCAAAICYGAQALVSIAQPITTPLLIIFLALCAGANSHHTDP
jgi:hypothetical protein